MKIQVSSNTLPFARVRIGQVFRFEDSERILTSMRIEEIQSSFNTSLNAVDLDTGNLITMYDDEQVVIYPDAQLIL